MCVCGGGGGGRVKNPNPCEISTKGPLPHCQGNNPQDAGSALLSFHFRTMWKMPTHQNRDSAHSHSPRRPREATCLAVPATPACNSSSTGQFVRAVWLRNKSGSRENDHFYLSCQLTLHRAQFLPLLIPRTYFPYPPRRQFCFLSIQSFEGVLRASVCQTRASEAGDRGL